MKTFKFSKNSWHFWLAKNFGYYSHWETETDICLYTRKVINGLLLFLFVTFTLFVLAAVVVTPIVWGIQMGIAGFTYIPIKDGSWTKFCTVLDGTVLICVMIYWLTFSIATFVSESDNFAVTSYRAFKGKFCAKVKFIDE